MKIITWNCNMAFRRKAEHLLMQKPDIAIIPECEHPEKLKFRQGISSPLDQVWIGENKNKGLGVFSYSNYRFQVHQDYDNSFRNIVPIHVTGGRVDFTLFAIWANNPADKGYTYVGQIWKALKHYNQLLDGEEIILAGDFNSNTIWDKPRREGNHSTIVKLLESKKIYSTYHHFHQEEQGKEKQNTLFMYRHADKAYHIDYCFASEALVKKLKLVKVGAHRKWKELSDHTPLTIQFDI